MNLQLKSMVFAPVGLWDVHHADAIELLFRLKSEHRKIFLVLCYGELLNCAPNSSHCHIKCIKCNKISDYTKKFLLPDEINVIKLQVIQEPFSLPSLSIEHFLDLSFEELPYGRLVASQLADDVGSYYFYEDWDHKIKHVQKMVLNCINLYKTFKTLISDNNIDEVFSWNGRRPSDGPILYAAKQLGKKYFSFICGSKPQSLFVSASTSVQDIKTKIENISKIKPFFSLEMRKQAEQYLTQYLNGKLNQIGYINYSKNEKILLDKSKKNLLFVSSSPQETMHDKLSSDFYGLKPYEKMFSFLNQEELIKNFNIIIRWHPRKAFSKSLDKRIILNLEKCNPRIKHIYPESEIKTEELVKQSDVIVGTGSSLCLYAVTLSKPVVLFGPIANYYGESVYFVEKPRELAELLRSELKPKQIDDALILAYYHSSFGEPNRHVFFKNKNGNKKIFLRKSFLYKKSIHPKLTNEAC